jgi:hypothetical protein
MRRWLAAMLMSGCLVVGCKAEDDYPLQPNDPNGMGMPRPGPDARSADDGGVEGAIRGKVCVVPDLRQPEACAATGSKGVVVREAGTTTQTVSGEGGTFELKVAARDVAILEVGVENSALVPSLVPLAVGSARAQAPVPRRAEYEAALEGLTGLPPNGSGTLALYFLKRDGNPLAGVVVDAPEGSINAPLYDVSGSSQQWASGGATGPYAASLVVGVPAGTVVVGATGPGGENLGASGVRIADGHVTFVTRQVEPLK